MIFLLPSANVGGAYAPQHILILSANGAVAQAEAFILPSSLSAEGRDRQANAIGSSRRSSVFRRSRNASSPRTGTAPSVGSSRSSSTQLLQPAYAGASGSSAALSAR